jgi:hypothetical protein
MTPDYVFPMVRRDPPVEGLVVEGSTPVVAFGDPTLAEVATLGINPSAHEFLRSGELLMGPERRLATLESLGADSLEKLTDVQVAEVVADCATYFHRQPYKRWFDPLDRLLLDAVGASYYNGSVCHLDLVQWATDPVWSKIPDQRAREVLLDDGVPHLRAQLQQEHVRLVVLNGRAVIKQVQAAGLVELEVVDRIPLRKATYELVAGTAEGVEWRGWSANLQGSFGMSNVFRDKLAAWLRGTARSSVEPPSTTPAVSPGLLDPDGYLRQGLRVDSKSQLVAELRHWLDGSEATTLGDVGTFGGRPWLYVKVDGYEIGLNADTTREAVDTFVRDPASAPEGPWRVVANRRGRINKVIPGPSPLPGWYAYLTRPTDHERTI